MFNKLKHEKLTEKFGLALVKLDWMEFIGVAHILCLPITKDDEPREFYELFCAILDKYETIGIPQKKQLLDVVKSAVKK